MWEQCSKAIKGILDANTLFANTYTYEASELSGTPVATLTPSANESEYTTTTENGRVYAFVLRLYTLRPTGNENERTTEEAMRELVDSVLDDLDKNHRLSTLESKAGYTFILLEAAPSAWGYVGRDNEYRVAEIAVRCLFSVDVNIIT